MEILVIIFLALLAVFLLHGLKNRKTTRVLCALLAGAIALRYYLGA